MSALKDALVFQLGQLVLDIEPIGSFAIPDMWSKPIIDLMVKVGGRLDDSAALLVPLGFEMIVTAELADRIVMRHRAADGDPDAHVHLVNENAWHVSLERKFRRLLSQDAALAAAYSAAKVLIYKHCDGDPQRYGSAKTAFIAWATSMVTGELQRT
jgi:GrpB-like predicted nucleotidyltransferase (UPF0157 family)